MSNAVRIPGQRLGSNVIMGRLNQGRGTGPAQQLSISQLATVIANNGALPLPSAGSGLISSVDTNFTVTGGGELELHTIASGDLLGNATGSTAEPTATTLTALIDEAIGSTEGDILYRDSAVWKVLAPGTLNYVLTMGAAIPAWAVAAGGISFTYEGAWSGTAGYSPGNVATYLGSAYCNYVAVSAPSVSNDQWNSSDSFDMTISTTNTTNDTATTQAHSDTYVNALSVGKTSGLWYFEAVCSNLLDNGTSLGIGAANWDSGGGLAGIYMVGNALGNIGGSASGAGSGSFAGVSNGKRAGVAVNFTTNKFWITADVTAASIAWNGSTSNSPGAGTGGISMGTLTGAMFPTWVGANSAGQVCVIYATSTGASAVIIPAIPAGFSLWAPSSSPNTSPDQDITHWLSQGNNNSETGPTLQTFTSGSGTYTTPAGVKWIKIRLIGPGGGGNGGAGAGASNGSAATTFSGGTLSGGAGAGAGSGGSPGAGGAASGGNVMNVPGNGGNVGTGSITGTLYGTGGNGGAGLQGGGAGAGGSGNAAGTNAGANTGSGGGGGGVGSGAGTASSGGGGGSGGYVEHIIDAPAATYTYTVGSGGNGSAAGEGSAGAGGNGAAGYIVVEEHYNY